MDNLTVDRHLCLFEILYCHKLVDLASEFLFNHWIYIQPGFHSIKSNDFYTFVSRYSWYLCGNIYTIYIQVEVCNRSTHEVLNVWSHGSWTYDIQ